MLAAEAEADESGRDPPQEPAAIEEPQRPRRPLQGLGADEEAADDPVLRGDLEGLGRPRRPAAAALDGGEEGVWILAAGHFEFGLMNEGGAVRLYCRRGGDVASAPTCAFRLIGGGCSA